MIGVETLSLPRVVNFKFPLQPNQKYYITQYGELDFSWVTDKIWLYIYQFLLPHTFLVKCWENELFELGGKGLCSTTSCEQLPSVLFDKTDNSRGWVGGGEIEDSEERGGGIVRVLWDWGVRGKCGQEEVGYCRIGVSQERGEGTVQ